VLSYFGFSIKQCNTSFLAAEIVSIEDKQRGVHVFGRLDATNLQPLVQTNVEWITLVPYAGQKDVDSPLVVHNRGDSLRLIRRNADWLEKIKIAKQAGFKVFVKPHIWLNEPSNGKWRSDIYPTSEENWEEWKKGYRAFIFRWADIAEQADAEMFCIGTEFTRLTVKKPEFWKALIQEVRGIYSGKIAYAANWYNEFEKITFWEDLDYIGVQAYFPLVNNEYPNVKEISKGWNKHLTNLESIHRKYNRPILFTEMGYKSTADSAIEPWDWIDYSSDLDKPISNETQANCYEAFFKTVWKKNWFAGVHIWQWRSDFEKGRGKNELDFTPQEKPAQTIIKKGFETN